HLGTSATVGARAVCRLAGKRVVGVILDTRHGTPPPRVRSLEGVLEGPGLPLDLVQFLREVANYYLAPIGEVVKMALPPTDRATAQAVCEPSLFSTKLGIAVRQVKWVIATDGGGALDPASSSCRRARVPSPSALTLLAHVRAVGPLPLTKLEMMWPSARA